MTATLDSLVLDLVEWVDQEPRPYAQVIEAWRTSCPRLTVWEDAVDRGLVCRETQPERSVIVFATVQGRECLYAAGRLKR